MLKSLDFMRYAGLDVIEAPARIEPILSLSKDTPVTDSFRKEMDSWLLDMFGVKDLCSIPKGMCYMFGNVVVMRPESLVLINNLGV